MKRSNTDLSPKEREWVERVLQLGEPLLLVVKPQPRLFANGRLFNLILGTIFLAVFLPQASTLDSITISILPFLLAGFWLVSSPLRGRILDRRAMYLLTDRRFVRLYLNGLLKQQENSYPLRANTQIRTSGVCPNGTGDLILDYEVTDEKCAHSGMLSGVPQVERVAEAARALLQQGNYPALEKKSEAGEHGIFRRYILPLIISLLVALAFGGIGSTALYNTMELRLRGETAQATVVGHEHERREYAILQFTTKDGQTICGKNSFGGNMIRFRKGERVKVYYNQQKPQHFQSAGFFHVLAPGIFLLVGIIAACMWIGLLLDAIQTTRQKRSNFPS